MAITLDGTNGISTPGIVGNLSVSGTSTFTGNATASGTLTSTGLITASAGMAVGGTGAANTLDDYEEGSFTPRFRGVSSEPGTLITGDGAYTKIGNQVTILVHFNNKNMSGYSGHVKIDSLPFIQGSGFNASGAAGMIYSLLGANANREHTAFFIGNTANDMAFYDVNADGAWTVSNHAAPAGCYFWTMFTYFTA